MDENIIGNYRLVNCILTGQTSQVWEVVEAASQRHFAMKVLLPAKSDDETAKAMLYHEAQVGIDMVHQNVIRIVYVSKEKVNHYFVMEYFPAGSLKSRLIQKKFDFIREHAMSIFKQAATGLAYINTSGWVHRDVKPDNMLVNNKGELRLIDFAIAQRIKKESFFSKFFKKKTFVQGTRSYMSPEQIRGENLDARADIYSYGASLYELVTYRPPFRAATEDFSDLVIRCLAKKREDRPESFHEILRKLNQIRVYKNDPMRKPGQ
jgi:serine/threonine protein kinase